jgi:hypothetical protein
MSAIGYEEHRRCSQLQQHQHISQQRSRIQISAYSLTCQQYHKANLSIDKTQNGVRYYLLHISLTE